MLGRRRYCVELSDGDVVFPLFPGGGEGETFRPECRPVELNGAEVEREQVELVV